MSNIVTAIAGMAMGENLTSIQLAGLSLVSAGLFMLEWGPKGAMAVKT
jgi:multidrug transporter EmrE-like cation transporter